MTDEELDERILSNAKPRWQKVAMMIAKSTDYPSDTYEADCHRTAARIEELVESGRLEVQGDVRLWRYSEVRLP